MFTEADTGYGYIATWYTVAGLGVGATLAPAMDAVLLMPSQPRPATAEMVETSGHIDSHTTRPIPATRRRLSPGPPTAIPRVTAARAPGSPRIQSATLRHAAQRSNHGDARRS
ncbi:hypothetical protein GCM10007977_081170 [Dactylosporangium sucinum]|uniref:Uncharacterized protein n=1 Tax=Dactylosporangium sucinum TaxID=1424081 RepID=A0A917U9E1_9ACTN|nr:hypothetical protein GCM10007977_081170 [Dactylosporangium sucinum]